MGEENVDCKKDKVHKGLVHIRSHEPILVLATDKQRRKGKY